jgi:hypothetical protein
MPTALSKESSLLKKSKKESNANRRKKRFPATDSNKIIAVPQKEGKPHPR